MIGLILLGVAVVLGAAALLWLRARHQDRALPAVPEAPANLAEIFNELRLTGPASARVLVPIGAAGLTAETMDRINQQVGITAPSPVMTRSMLTDLLTRLELIEAEIDEYAVPGQVSEWETFLDRQMSRFEKSQRTRVEDMLARPAAPKPVKRTTVDPASVRPVVGSLPDDVQAMSRGRSLQGKARRRLEARQAPPAPPEPKHIAVTRGRVLPGMSWRELGLPEDIPEAFLT